MKLLRASNRMDSLTRDLLKLSKLSAAGRGADRAVDVAEIVQDIVLLTPELQNGVLTVAAPLGQVWAQRTLLQQCLSNLFDNALKFIAAPGTKPKIIVRADSPCEDASRRRSCGCGSRTTASASEPDQHGPRFSASSSGWADRTRPKAPASDWRSWPGPCKRMGGACGVRIRARSGAASFGWS